MAGCTATGCMVTDCIPVVDSPGRTEDTAVADNLVLDSGHTADILVLYSDNTVDWVVEGIPGSGSPADPDIDCCPL